MCKEMPVNLVNRVVDTKRIIGKMESRGGGRHKGLLTQKKPFIKTSATVFFVNRNSETFSGGIIE
jgi:hypothetical protein